MHPACTVLRPIWRICECDHGGIKVLDVWPRFCVSFIIAPQCRPQSMKREFRVGNKFKKWKRTCKKKKYDRGMAGGEIKGGVEGQRKNKWYFKSPPCQWEDIHHFVRSQHVSHPSNPSLCRTFVAYNVGGNLGDLWPLYMWLSKRHTDNGRIIILAKMTSQKLRQETNKENTKASERRCPALWNTNTYWSFKILTRNP